MSIQTPKNRNFLAPIGYDFAIRRLPNVEYFVHQINLPGISSSPAREQTPFNVIKFQPDHVEYNELSVEFKVDEDLKNWIEIYEWMQGITFPEKYEQYKELKEGRRNNSPGGVGINVRNSPPGDIYSDCTLLIHTNKSNLNVEVTYLDAYPLNLSDIAFNSTDEDVEYITATVTFMYQHYNIRTRK